MNINIRDYNRLLIENAQVRLVEETEEDWIQSSSQKIADDQIRVLWYSEAPGSGAPSSVLAGAIQATRNLGYCVDEAEELFFDGLNHISDITVLSHHLSKIFYLLNNAPKDPNSSYWDYTIYHNWSQVLAQLKAQKIASISADYHHVKEKIKWGWLGQIVAGAFGTTLEGYSRRGIAREFGEVKGYLKTPSTYNDDLTFELALLKAFLVHGQHTTSLDIAEQWIALIPFGWSAEDIALKNLRLGIYPPQSGLRSNPYREWIGAQMRGAICGMIAPSNPLEAARIAWMDGEISHANNGILGEIFNAVLTSLAFAITDVNKLIESALTYLPYDSLYYQVVNDTYQKCLEHNDVELTLDYIEEAYGDYNLVHAFPNAAIEIMALYYGQGDFDKTMMLVAKAGLDVDCNAAQLGNIVGILNYQRGIPSKWLDPFGKTIKTYVRTLEEIAIADLVAWTYQVAQQLRIKN